MATQLEEQLEELLCDTEVCKIVVFNDNINTFPYVTACLVKYCDHSVEQADQCTLNIHNTGKAEVKIGTYERLKPVCDALLNRGLKAEIQ